MKTKHTLDPSAIYHQLLKPIMIHGPPIEQDRHIPPQRNAIGLHQKIMQANTPSSTPLSSESTSYQLETIAPNIYVSDIHRTTAFYQLLGFDIIDSVPDAVHPIFVLMKCGHVSVMFQTFDSIKGMLPAIKREDGGSLLLYIKLKGIRNFYERIKDHVTVLQGMEKTFYGATEFSILDDNNFMLTFAEDE